LAGVEFGIDCAQPGKRREAEKEGYHVDRCLSPLKAEESRREDQATLVMSQCVACVALVPKGRLPADDTQFNEGIFIRFTGADG
jgi:hypothetical protein